MNTRTHYNHVTDAWKEFMGNNLHFGYFEKEGVTLAEATDTLIDKLISLCKINENSRILDVGCGIGNPAFYLHERYRCKITGISTSERGVQLANMACKEKGYHDVQFLVADGCNNHLPDDSFDIIWIMESSHLMSKKRLFRECYRVLKQHGILLICDLVILKMPPFLEKIPRVFLFLRRYINLLKTWGNASMRTFGTYCNALVEAGFHDISFINITEKTFPTLKCWQENAHRLSDKAINNFSKKDAHQFVKGCNFLADYFREGMVGYGMIKASKLNLTFKGGIS